MHFSEMKIDNFLLYLIFLEYLLKSQCPAVGYGAAAKATSVAEAEARRRAICTPRTLKRKRNCGTADGWRNERSEYIK